MTENSLAQQLRAAMSSYPTGVALVAAHTQGRTVGMLMNSLTSISLEPALLSLCFSATSPTWHLLEPLPVWGISILGGEDTEQAMELVRPSDVRFQGVDITVTEEGAVLLPDAAATFIVRRSRDVEAGDHILTLLEVIEATRHEGVAPIVSYASGMSPWHI